MIIVNLCGYDVMLDDEDLEKVEGHNWHIDTGSFRRGKVYFFYMDYKRIAMYNYVNKRVSLHRTLMNAPKGLVIDHIDGNTLNCQKSNMRICTQAENNKNMKKPWFNTSGYKGVSWHKGHKRWRADISIDNHQKSLGEYDTPEEAYKIYCEAKKNLHGKYVRFD